MSSPGEVRRRIVVIAPHPPTRSAADAGTVYLQQLADALAEVAEVTFLVPDYGENRRIAEEQQATQAASVRLLVPHRTAPRVVAAARRLNRWIASIDRTTPYLPLLLELRSGPARAAIRNADVVDLQFPDMLGLAPAVRLLNPRARLIRTHHDLLSQRFSRQAAGAETAGGRLKWRWHAARARRRERALGRRTSGNVVFSTKDADLLSGSAIVVDPPLTGGAVDPAPLEDRPLQALFVGFLGRVENATAVEWLLAEVWPLVRAAEPTATLCVVGAGASSSLRARVQSAGGVTLAGFVDDLDAAYQQARVCVVPLRQGAGVKFKTIEAMVAGTPVVATTVGAEGVTTGFGLAGLTDEPTEFAAAVVAALRQPDQAAAAEVRAWAREKYGARAFRHAVAEIYVPGPVS